MNIRRAIASCASLFGWFLLSACLAVPGCAETPIQPAHPTAMVTETIDESILVTLHGSVHPLATPAADQGASPGSLQLGRTILVLKRHPLQQAALDKLANDQQNPKSPHYHKWLTPEQFGAQFGLASQDIEKITQWLGVISGLSIFAIGLWMIYKRWRGVSHHNDHHHDHVHTHDHDHAHAHTHDHHRHEHSHDHSHDHPHSHDHGHTHHHHHGPGGHSHVPDELSWGGLVALGASGGLVPCESALVLLLGAIALQRVGLGLMLLISFSAGLAVVLMAVGAIVLYARNLLPDRKGSSSNPIFRYAPIASAAIVTIIGVIMTGVSLGWIRPGWMIG